MATLSACWDWKVEPVSPGFTSPDNEFDAWSLEDEVTHITPKLEKDELHNSNSASEFLDDFDEWIKEEPFAIWLEEKIELPIFEDLPVPVQESRSYSQFVRGNNTPVKPSVVEVKNIPSQQYVVPDDTHSLLQEFESVLGEVEQNNGTLTPPQSPPQPQYSGLFQQDIDGGDLLITTLQQMIPLQIVPGTNFKISAASPVLPTIPGSYSEKKDTTHLITGLEQIVPSTPVHDLASELAAVDELIRTRVEDLETSIPVAEAPVITLWNQNTSSVTGNTDVNTFASKEPISDLFTITPPSPSTSSNSSIDSGEELCDDPEWIPVSVQGPAPGCQKVTGVRKRGAKPYGRVGTEEKRLRKKEQNKNAATRYRQKKKAEVEEILTEEKQLADINEELQAKVSDLSREIKYLKGLMRDVFKAKGLLK